MSIYFIKIIIYKLIILLYKHVYFLLDVYMKKYIKEAIQFVTRINFKYNVLKS